ncbi:MAG: phosphatidate cytidylyltransferase [Chitinophagales bacterium]
MNSNLATRIITGLTMAAVMLSCLYFSAFSLLAILLLFTFLGLAEFHTLIQQYSFYENKNSKNEKYILATIGSLIYLLISLTSINIINIKYVVLCIPIVCVLFLKELYAKTTQPYLRLGFNLTALAYIAVPFALMNSIASYDSFYQPHRILGLWLLLWANDVMAYFSGRAFGKHPLFKRISPKKTWEGAIGGGIATLIVAAAFAYYFDEVFTTEMWLGAGVIAVFFGVWGDLVESLLKRSIGVKDSGTILPGHGGILDRFDALLFATPLIYAWIILVK